MPPKHLQVHFLPWFDRRRWDLPLKQFYGQNFTFTLFAYENYQRVWASLRVALNASIFCFIFYCNVPQCFSSTVSAETFAQSINVKLQERGAAWRTLWTSRKAGYDVMFLQFGTDRTWNRHQSVRSLGWPTYLSAVIVVSLLPNPVFPLRITAPTVKLLYCPAGKENTAAS